MSTTRRTASTLPWIVLGTGLVALTLVFLPECRAAVRVWIDSTAYGHCFLVAPIAAFLAWDRRATVAGMRPQPQPWLLLLGLPLPLIWFAAERLGIMEGRQLAALAFVELLFLCSLGRTLFMAMLGPLLYLVFLVPFGAFLTPALQSFTAHFIDAGLTLLGIAHYSSDMYIEISAGTFFVAEACAGLRFLIAAVAFGVFYALLNYRSYGRRAVFIAASIIVPVIANGIRALGIVVLGYILGSAQAAAADHIIYGWLFFSAVTLLLAFAGLPFRENPAVRPPRPEPTAAPAPGLRPWAALLVPVLAAAAPAAALAMSRGLDQPNLAGPLAMTAPDGCKVTPASDATPATPSRATDLVECGARTWRITLQAFPRHSTTSAITEARLSLIGAADPERTTFKSVTGIPPAAGIWTAMIDPPSVTAYSVWIDGAPSKGGIRQRIDQARDSIEGATIPPILLVATLQPPGAVGESPISAALTELAHIIAAQPDWSSTITRLTEPSSRPPPP